MAGPDSWRGEVRRRSASFDDVWLTQVTDRACHTSMSPFRGVASDGNDYFIKLPTALQATFEAALAIEFIVSRLGKLIGAPVCETSLIQIPSMLEGESVGNGQILRPGIAHGSRVVDRVTEGRTSLRSRHRDHNGTRHVGIYALVDWCFGNDLQWLYAIDEDEATYSHDHGHYLRIFQAGARVNLMQHADEPRELTDDPYGLDKGQVIEVVERLRSIQRPVIASILNEVPSTWAVSDDDLEVLGWFLHHRTEGVAQRLMRRAGMEGNR